MIQSAAMQDSLPLEWIDELLAATSSHAQMERFLALAHRHLRPGGLSIWLFDATGLRLEGRCGVAPDGAPHELRGQSMLLEEFEKGLETGCFVHRRIWCRLTSPVPIVAPWEGDRMLPAGTLMMPLPGDQGAIGVLLREPGEGRDATCEEERRLALFAGIAARLASRRSVEEHGGGMLQGLQEVLLAADELSRCVDFDTLTRRAVELARERLGIVRASIYLLQDTDPPTLRGTWGTDIERRTTDERANIVPIASKMQWLGNLFHQTGRRWVLRQPVPLSWYEDGSIIEYANGWVEDHFLFMGEDVVGVLFVDPGNTGLPPDPVRQELTSVYGSIVGSLVERRRIEDQTAQRLERMVEERTAEVVSLAADLRAKNAELETINRRLQELAERDSLTGLYNHGAFQKRLDFLLSMAQRNGFPLAVAMIDIDHFKRINDRWGHQTGDEILKAVASILAAGAGAFLAESGPWAASLGRELRDYDIVGRYGGDEFAVVLPFCGRAAVETILARIGQSVRALRLPAVPDLRASLSIGSCHIDRVPRECDSTQVIAAADAVLYRVKQHGRDAVQVEPPPAAGEQAPPFP